MQRREHGAAQPPHVEQRLAGAPAHLSRVEREQVADADAALLQRRDDAPMPADGEVRQDLGEVRHRGMPRSGLFACCLLCCLAKPAPGQIVHTVPR